MRLLAAIPVHNEEKYLEDVLREVARYAENILVVDDGSTDRTPELLRRFAAVKVLRHTRNLGYGAGLRTAFQQTIEGGYDALVTLDCDGQHEPSRIPSSPGVSRRPTSSRGAVISGVFDPDQGRPKSAGGSTLRSRAGSTNASA